VAAYSNLWCGKACHITTNLNHLFSFVDTSRHLALASPLSCPHSFLTPQTPIAGHTTRPLLRGGGPFLPAPRGARIRARQSCRGPCTPHPVLPMNGALPIARQPPCLRPAPRLCTNGVRARVTQGQGRRPFYAPPLRSPHRFQGRGKVCDPSLCPRPLLHADAPLFAQILPFAPCCVRTGFASESCRVRAPLLCPSSVQPPPFVGAHVTVARIGATERAIKWATVEVSCEYRLSHDYDIISLGQSTICMCDVIMTSLVYSGTA
jgi:hypothetical protein